jgi:glycosyltransferase involved in cell wall biosynthesis
VPTPSRVARVLILAPTPFFGDRGCHVRIYEEAQGLQAKGIDVLIATYSTGRDVQGLHVRRSVRLPGFRAKALGPSYARPVLDLLLLATAIRAARRFKPQIIHAHLHEGIAIGAIVRLLAGAPLVADLQGSLAAELADHRFLRPNGFAAALVNRLEKWLVRRPDAVLASSVAAMPLLVDGNRSARVIALPDGVDVQQFYPRAPDETLRRELGLVGKRVVVFLGVLTPYQGVDALIEAIPSVAGSVPDVHFLIMGYPDEDRYRARIKARGLDQWATVPGRVPYEDAPRWLSLGAVAVSPKQSLTEANGKLLNYMACGLPIVATDTPVNRELLGESGVYAPVGDTAALADRLIELLQAPERRRSLGAALRLRVEREFGWPALTDRLIELYRQVLGPLPVATTS